MTRYENQRHEQIMEENARHQRNAELRDEAARLEAECGTKHKLGSCDKCSKCYQERHKNDPPPTLASDDYR